MTGQVHSRRRRASAAGLAILVGLTLVTAAASSVRPDPAAGAQPTAPAAIDPAALVHPLDGTATGPVSPGTVGEFPGADLPFGMIQWSPDTSPNTVQSGGGYAYEDSAINGFSLTHLSGTGCPSYQDIPILPTVGPVDAPATTSAPFSHRRRAGVAGQLPRAARRTVADRGLARRHHSFGDLELRLPGRNDESNVLFKVADSSNPVTASSVHVVGHDEVEGQVSSGQFCGTGTTYTLHFAARFDRPFSSAGTWGNCRAQRPGLRRAPAPPAAPS